MSEENVVAAVEGAMNPETFDVLSYLDGQPIAEDKITIYVDVPKARRLHQLMDERKELIERRKNESQSGKSASLSLVEDDEETEYDEEINELVSALEKTAMHFELQTVAPKLVRSIEKHYTATAPSDNAVALEDHNHKKNADILSRAIKQVTVGNGQVDADWSAEKLMALEDRLYPQQAQRLVSALYDMVHTGYVFDEALTVDFS